MPQLNAESQFALSSIFALNTVPLTPSIITVESSETTLPFRSPVIPAVAAMLFVILPKNLMLSAVRLINVSDPPGPILIASPTVLPSVVIVILSSYRK